MHSIRSYPCGVGCLRIVLQDPGESKVRHFAHKVTVDQDVPSSKVSVHIAHVGQVLHACGDAPQHAHDLNHSELPIVFLQR